MNKYQKLMKEQPELVERVIEKAVSLNRTIELTGETTVYKDSVIADLFLTLNESLQPQTYKLFGLKITGEPPLTEAPEDKTRVWFITPFQPEGYICEDWNAHVDWHHRLLRMGFAFASEEGALPAAKALGFIEQEKPAFKVGDAVSIRYTSQVGVIVEQCNIVNTVEFGDGSVSDFVSSDLELIQPSKEGE